MDISGTVLKILNGHSVYSNLSFSTRIYICLYTATAILSFYELHAYKFNFGLYLPDLTLTQSQRFGEEYCLHLQG
jgi:hypothetical protein